MVSLEYIAGFFDGEGCITADKNAFTVRLSITNTQKAVLDEIQKVLGGFVRSKDVAGPNRQPSWELRYAKRATVKHILEILRPYLVVKSVEAWLALEYIALHEHCKSGKLRTDYDKALSYGFYLAIKGVKYDRASY